MQVSDVAFGLLLLALLVWTMMIALNQNSMALVINNIPARQGALISDAGYCGSMQGFDLIQHKDLGFKEYTLVPVISDTNRLVLCVYEKTTA